MDTGRLGTGKLGSVYWDVKREVKISWRVGLLNFELGNKEFCFLQS